MGRRIEMGTGGMRAVRALLLSFVIIATLATGIGVAQAQTDTTIDPRCQDRGYNVVVTITTDDSTPQASQTVTISGSGFLPNETITIYANGVPVSTVQTSDSGSFTTTYTVPADAIVGSQIQIEAVGACDTASLTLTVGESGAAGEGPAGTTGGGLPRTGTDVAWLIRLGILLVAGGGIVVLYTRKRRGQTIQSGTT